MYLPVLYIETIHFSFIILVVYFVYILYILYIPKLMLRLTLLASPEEKKKACSKVLNESLLSSAGEPNTFLTPPQSRSVRGSVV